MFFFKPPSYLSGSRVSTDSLIIDFTTLNVGDNRAVALEDSSIAASVSANVRFEGTQAGGTGNVSGMLGIKTRVDCGTCSGRGGGLIHVDIESPGSLYPESIVEIEGNVKSTLQSISRPRSSEHRG
jgi:hypothetical protein